MYRVIEDSRHNWEFDNEEVLTANSSVLAYVEKIGYLVLGVSLIFIINNPVITKAIFLILLGVIATTEWQQVKVREKSVKIITYGIAYKGLRFTEEYQFKGIAEWECETGGLKVGEIAFFVLLSSIGRPFHNRNKFFNPNVIDFDYRDNGETSTVHRELNIRVKDMERINSMVQEKVCLNS